MDGGKEMVDGELMVNPLMTINGELMVDNGYFILKLMVDRWLMVDSINWQVKQMISVDHQHSFEGKIQPPLQESPKKHQFTKSRFFMLVESSMQWTTWNSSNANRDGSGMEDVQLKDTWRQLSWSRKSQSARTNK